jgi:hypothetical protein
MRVIYPLMALLLLLSNSMVFARDAGLGAQLNRDRAESGRQYLEPQQEEDQQPKARLHKKDQTIEPSNPAKQQKVAPR